MAVVIPYLSAIWTWLTTTTIGQAVLSLAAYAIIGQITKPKFDRGQGGYKLGLRFEPTYPREVVVGRSAVSGSLVYATTSGSENKYLWRVIALSDTKIFAVDEIWGGGKKLTFDGDVTTGWRYCTSHYSDGSSRKLRCRVYKGDDDQLADADLMAAQPSEWTSTCRLRGVAYAILRMEFSTEAFANGEPDLFFVVRGAECYDPRTSSSAYSDNATLIAGQFATGFTNNGVRVVGLGAAAADVPASLLSDAADICDEDVSLAAGGTEKRYRANGVISGEEQPRGVFDDLTLAMGGSLVNRGGEIVFLPGAAQTPVLALGRALTDDDFLADAPIEYENDRPGDELVNVLHSRYVDPSEESAWQDRALPVRKNDASISDLGARYPKSRSYRFVTSNTQAQRLDKMALEEAKYQGRARVTCGAWGIVYEPGDWEQWTSNHFGGATKTFRIDSTELDFVSGGIDGEPRARVVLNLTEIDATYDDWSTSDESGAVISQVARTVPALTIAGLAVAPALTSLGGVAIPELRVTWTAITDPAIISLEFEYKVASDSVVYRAAATPESTSLALQNGVYPGQTYEVRARARSADRVGAWTSWEQASTATAAQYDALNAAIASSITGQGALATLDVVGAAQLAAATGGNVLIDTTFQFGETYWIGAAAYTNTGLTSTATQNSTASGLRYFKRQLSGTPTAGTFFDIVQAQNAATLDVLGGERVEVSVYCAAAAVSRVDVSVYWFDASGGYINEAVGGFTTDLFGSNFADDLTNARRIGGIVTIPTGVGARKAVMFVRATCHASANPYVEIALPLMRFAHSGQAELSDYTPGLLAEYGADITSGNTAAAIAGQGALATRSAVTYYDTTAPGSPIAGDIWHDTDDAQLRVYRWNGSAWQVIADITSGNTAAAVAGQSPLATYTPPSYAGNSAALAGGLVAGDSYIDTSDGNKLKTVTAGASAAAFSVSLSPTSLYAERSGAGAITSPSVTATPANGSGTYTYSWAYVTGSAFTINSPTSATTTFSATIGGSLELGVFACTVRDSSTAQIVVANLAVQFNPTPGS